MASFAPVNKFRYWADSASSEWKGPSIALKEKVKDGNSIQINLKSNRSASRIVLLLPEDSNLKSFNIGTQEIKTSAETRGPFKGYYFIYLSGMYDKEIDLVLNFDDYQKDINGYLLDISTQLPKHLNNLYEARSGYFFLQFIEGIKQYS